MKNRLKKEMTLTLAAMMSLTALAGCEGGAGSGGKKAGSNGKELSITAQTNGL